MDAEDHLCLTSLMAGRNWIWIAGNHDPGPIGIGGSHKSEIAVGPLHFRHIADLAKTAEVSGHFHPKARLSAKGRGMSRPCFLLDNHRLIMPAYGTYTGGLRSDSAALAALMEQDAVAILTGKTSVAIPMPR